MRKIFYLVPLLVLSCSEDDVIKPYKNTLAGNYRIASVTTDIPLDINLDGVESTNYYEELSGLHYFNGKEADGVIMTNLNSYGFQAELRPSKDNIEFGNLTQFVNFNFPVQWVVRADYNDEDSAVLQYSYEGSFNGYMYEFTTSNEINLTGGKNPYNSGFIEKMIQVDENHFVLEMNLSVFKYNEKRWVTTKATTVYKRYYEDK